MGDSLDVKALSLEPGTWKHSLRLAIAPINLAISDTKSGDLASRGTPEI